MLPTWFGLCSWPPVRHAARYGDVLCALSVCSAGFLLLCAKKRLRMLAVGEWGLLYNPHMQLSSFCLLKQHPLLSLLLLLRLLASVSAYLMTCVVLHHWYQQHCKVPSSLVLVMACTSRVHAVDPACSGRHVPSFLDGDGLTDGLSMVLWEYIPTCVGYEYHLHTVMRRCMPLPGMAVLQHKLLLCTCLPGHVM